MIEPQKTVFLAGIDALVDHIAAVVTLRVLSQLDPRFVVNTTASSSAAPITELNSRRPEAAPAAAGRPPAQDYGGRPAAAPAAAAGTGKPAPWREGDQMITPEHFAKMALKENGGIFQQKGMNVLRDVVNEIEPNVQFGQLTQAEAKWAVNETYLRLGGTKPAYAAGGRR